MNKLINNEEVIIKEVKSLIEESKHKIVSYVNTTLLFTYWNIGKKIIEYQGGKEKAKYGDKFIERLSKELTNEYGKGFDVRKLNRMKLFYLVFPIWETVSPKLGWSHYILIIPLNDSKKRTYYITEAINRQLSVRELERLIKTNTYEREKTNQIEYKNNHNKNLDISILKNPYILDFLDLKYNYKEKDLENSIIDNISKFLLELGKGYLFHSRQKQLKIDNKTYYVDLVFYNSILKCYVLIDLKINKLSKTDISQMDLYCNYFDNNIRTEEERNTIGLILVKENDKVIIQYSSILKDKNIYVSLYKDVLPSNDELIKIINQDKMIYIE